MNKTRTNLVRLLQLMLLVAIEVIFAFTPLGFIPTPAAAITTMHLPVIIGAVLLGPLYGGILGAVFGVLSLIKASLTPNTALSFILSPLTSGAPLASIFTCIVPRILLGVIAAYGYRLFTKLFRRESISIGVSAGVATACHTIMVMGSLWILFGAVKLKDIFLAIVGVSGVLEILAAVLIVSAVCIPLKKYLKVKG